MGLRQMFQIACCGVTVVLGLLLALVLDAGPLTAMGWLMAAVAAIGLIVSFLAPAR